MRIVLDTNVLISALFKRDSTSAQILRLWQDGQIQLLISPPLLEEIDRVLGYPKVQKRLIYSSAEIQTFLRLLTVTGTMIRPQTIPQAVEADPDDDYLIALAVAGQAECLVSGDAHLLDLEFAGEAPILSPRAFLAWWLATGSK